MELTLTVKSTTAPSIQPALKGIFMLCVMYLTCLKHQEQLWLEFQIKKHDGKFITLKVF